MNVLAEFHLASQYLAMAGKSFLEAKDDDSHTNLGFFKEDNTIRTWSLDNSGTYLAFSFDSFALQWGTDEAKVSFALKGKSHADIISWISKMAVASKIDKPYNYDLHYDLPFNQNDNYVFELSDKEILNNLLQLRILAQDVLKIFLNKQKLESDIRIWPHHLDTGAFFVLKDDSGKSIGMGMAIPDSLIDDHYFYISGYKGHNSLNPDNFSKLTHGEWKNNGFKGAILPSSNTTQKQALQFLDEAFHQYLGIN
ncbi:hypothetical protein [Croceitalea sp. P059]|uniref:hypothetical protein n=1 Tax=Croceitalea sp. P059 TaxID=3075601 RepID=UPI0028868CE0|nr:hypothetical protein [Croceitalea sp. P059]MDT0539412.1 hypothetical protein [Croceitalea sp. P059]